LTKEKDASPSGDADQDGGQVRFKPSPQLWKYLNGLSRSTLLGKSESDVAEHILTQRLTEMRQEDYKDPKNA